MSVSNELQQQETPRRDANIRIVLANMAQSSIDAFNFPRMTVAPTTKKRQPRLILEIAIVLACKLLFIFCLWYFFFSPEHRTTVTPDRMDELMFSSADDSKAPATRTGRS